MTTYLLSHSIDDDDTDRKTQAEVLINTYNRELQRTRAAASAKGIYFASDGKHVLR